MLECSEQSNLIFNTIFRHDNHLLMAKYGLGCQAQAFQSILERGRCSTCSTAFCLSGELWNTSPTYRCTLLLVKVQVATLALDGRELLSVVASLVSTTVHLSVPLIDDCILDNFKGKCLNLIVINNDMDEVFPFIRKCSKCNHRLHLRGEREMGDIGSSPNCNMGKSLKSGSHMI